MSDQPQPPTGPRLCKMACGFFGSGATGDCCSKCWHENKNKAEAKAAAAVKEARRIEEFTPMDIDMTETEPPPQPQQVMKTPVLQEAPTSVPVKKKKKKASYKSMMAGMLETTIERDVEKEKEQLRKVTGGGAFSKIDKI
mmetsp:Transcript_19602/g.25274  ORF Transcript_19602/g.25274 Transcript_19602/m.25274 type:complete len:140 (+) Transcript_19602:147-566(+)|eukprot:CAMPEP_0198138168 /NCGR_PEP_ID=MMETSP1443-20131203/1590_1 /TAXON_ID=186043 /ORGANISM="Entomoneis sp., Strain CCMP2396" /LENGTH=139 /DNA_ID=CAMNT_0043799831 /DNA_START=147 /DNA_END=566 /DNA_ORIENTATION=+